MKLTKKQKEVILSATSEKDYCTIAHGNTIKSLVNKEVFNYTDGFGYRFGVIIELTEKDKFIQDVLAKKEI
jgi:hypothetical protein